MPRKSATNTENEDKIAPASETVKTPAKQMPTIEDKSENSKVETIENPMVETDKMHSNKNLPNQFQCYSCKKITEYFPQEYEETIESQTPIIAWRIFEYYIKCDNCGVLNAFGFTANRNKPNGVDAPPTIARPPGIKEEFYLSLAGEFIKNNTKFVNEVLRQLVTLNTALLGGTIAFMNKDVIREEFKIPIIIFLLGGLVIAFKGIFPYSGKISFLDPRKVEQFNKDAMEHKLSFIKLSGICSLTAFLLIIVAAIIKMFRP